jgi:hypothetical protein
MEKIFLNRINIAGNITEDTPICVILEIAESLYLNYDVKKINYPEYIYSIISTIKGCNEHFIIKNINYTLEELSLIAKFINSDINIVWRRSKLLQAFDHLLKYKNNNVPEIPTGEWKIGPQTMLDPISYNACILYKIISYYGISSNRNTTINDMAYSIKLLSYNNDELITKIQNNIKFLNKSSLIDILCKNNKGVSLELKFSPIPQHINNNNFSNIDKIDIKNLKESYYKIIDPNSIALIPPSNQYECIILAAKIYNIDISESQNPYKEYLNMREGNYIPIDPIFSERYRKNCNFFHIDKNWRPNLVFLYDNKQLTKFVKKEGFTDEDLIINSPLELLSQNIDTFYLGRHPDSINDTTLITFESLDNIDQNLIISYKYNNNIEAYEISELINHFKINKSFIHPIKYNIKLTDIAIRKLKFICKQFITNNNNSISNNYKELLEYIYIIENNEHGNTEYNNRFMKIMDTDNLLNNLNILLELGLYMRGWDGKHNNYPLGECPYRGDIDDNIYKLLDKYDNIQVYKELFDQMPLMILKHEENRHKFICSTRKEDGTTILEKIKIIKENNSIYACIRTSSNKILWTAIFFMKLLSIKPPFEYFLEIA